MSIPPLERALVLLEQGKRNEAQKLLKQLITEDQHNLAAWFWLLETCTTYGQQLHLLKMCLEYNPENEEVKQALEKLKTLSQVQHSAKFPKHEDGTPGSILEKRPLTNWEAVGLGFLLAAGVALLLYMRLPASGYGFPFYILAMILVFPFSIIGALIGKKLTKTRMGIWIGAIVAIFLEFWWMSSNYTYFAFSD